MDLSKWDTLCGRWEKVSIYLWLQVTPKRVGVCEPGAVSAGGRLRSEERWM